MYISSVFIIQHWDRRKKHTCPIRNKSWHAPVEVVTLVKISVIQTLKFTVTRCVVNLKKQEVKNLEIYACFT